MLHIEKTDWQIVRPMLEIGLSLENRWSSITHVILLAVTYCDIRQSDFNHLSYHDSWLQNWPLLKRRVNFKIQYAIGQVKLKKQLSNSKFSMLDNQFSPMRDNRDKLKGGQIHILCKCTDFIAIYQNQRAAKSKCFRYFENFQNLSIFWIEMSTLGLRLACASNEQSALLSVINRDAKDANFMLALL
jgi:hypothetical protein